MATVRFLASCFVPSKDHTYTVHDEAEIDNPVVLEKLVAQDLVDVLDTGKTEKPKAPKKTKTKKAEEPKTIDIDKEIEPPVEKDTKTEG